MTRNYCRVLPTSSAERFTFVFRRGPVLSKNCVYAVSQIRIWNLFCIWNTTFGTSSYHCSSVFLNIQEELELVSCNICCRVQKIGVLQDSDQYWFHFGAQAKLKQPFSSICRHYPLCAPTCFRDQKPLNSSGRNSGRKKNNKKRLCGPKCGGKKVMFDLKMKKTKGICSPQTVSSGFSLQDEWILAGSVKNRAF